MIRLRTGERWRAFDRVEPVHRRRGSVVAGLAGGRGRAWLCRGCVFHVDAGAAAIREIARVADAAPAAAEEVGVERDDDVRFVEVVDRVREPGRGLRGCGTGDAVPLVPLRLGKVLLDEPNLLADGRGGDRLGQEAKAGALH